MKILDFHVHYHGNDAYADRFVSRWREGGVEKACVFGMTDNDGHHVPLAKVAALAARYPDFVIPFAYVTPGHHDGVKEVREAAGRAFKGVKFIFPAKPYDDDEYFPIYEEAAKAGMVCLFHTGIVIGTARKDHAADYQRKWRVSSNYMRPACLDRIARAFPEMPVVGAHLGAGAWFEEATEMMVWNENVYFDLSIGQLHYVRKDVPQGQERRAIRPRLKELYDTGQLKLEKVLFGSDGSLGPAESSPAWALGTLQFELDGLGATDAEKDAVRWNTAAKLLGLD